MERGHYRIFSEARITTLKLPNRLVRSATWDPRILGRRRMTEEVLGFRPVPAPESHTLIKNPDKQSFF